MNGTAWTEEEDTFLHENKEMRTKELADILGRSFSSIRNRRLTIGIAKYRWGDPKPEKPKKEKLSITEKIELNRRFSVSKLTYYPTGALVHNLDDVILDITGTNTLWLSGIDERITDFEVCGKWNKPVVRGYEHGWKPSHKRVNKRKFHLIMQTDKAIMTYLQGDEMIKIFKIDSSGIEMFPIPDVGITRSGNDCMYIENWERE